MATQSTYDKCCQVLQQHPRYSLSSRSGNQRILHPPLEKLFGEVKLVSEEEFLACSELEKHRHLSEDNVLRSLYAKLDS